MGRNIISSLAMADDTEVTTSKHKLQLFGSPVTHPDRPTCVACLSDTRAVATDEHGKVRVWDISVDPPKEDPPAFKAHGGDKKGTYVTVSTAANKLFSASYDGVVNVSDLGRAFLYSFNKHAANSEVWCVAASSDGSRAVSSTNGGELLMWETAPAGGKVRGDPFGYTEDAVGGLTFLPGQLEQFLSGHGHGAMVWWDLSDPNRIRHIFSHGNSLPVNSVAVSPDGKYAASASFDMTVRIWELANPGQAIHTFADHKNYVWRVAFSPDSKLVASAGEDGKVFVWKVGGNWPQHQPPRDEPGGVMGVAFTPAGKIVYTSGNKNDPAVRFWDIPAP
jgi:WD40 repeat protein